jgi:hypothetical protein
VLEWPDTASQTSQDSPMIPFRALVALAVALILVACGGGSRDDASTLANVSLTGSPNATVIGPVDPHAERVSVSLGGRAVVAAFRAGGCGEDAPDFARTMRDQVRDGLRVPDGITLHDAGVGAYRSSRCNAQVPARAIGVYGNRQGTYELRFFGGETIRTVVVQ